MGRRLLFVLLYAVHIPFLIALIFVTILIMTPIVLVMWLLFGSKKYDLFKIWILPPNLVIELPYKITKIEL